jgi:glycine/D-amino acid oxidase-like deaminating enzyme
MLRTRAYGNTVQVGTMLAAGLTLRHYKSFADCPTLPLVAARYSREMPEYERFGIHVLVSQNGHGEIVLGDSHEYERDIEIFNNERIDQLVLNYLRSFLVLPELEIAARWAGYYMKHQKLSYILEHAEPNVALVGATGGCGMTLAFGIAEKTLEHLAIEPSARPA